MYINKKSRKGADGHRRQRARLVVARPTCNHTITIF